MVLALRGRHRPAGCRGRRASPRSALRGRCSSATTTGRTKQTDVAVTKDLVLTNHGAADVTLDLALTGTGGPFTLGASTVVVPAGGKATVAVTGDPRSVEFGRFTGYVVGTDAVTGQAVTRTSLALIKEDERYDLNIKLVGRDGKPAAGWVCHQPGRRLLAVERSTSTARTTMRMLPGTYAVGTYLDVAGEKADRSGLAVIVDPETVLNQAARRGARREQGTPAADRGAGAHRGPPAQGGLQHPLQRHGPRSSTSAAPTPLPPMYDDIYVSPTEQMTQGQFMLTTRWRKGEPLLGLSAGGSQLTFETLVQAGQHADGRHVRQAADGLRRQRRGGRLRQLNAKGKVVVVERSDEVSPQERAEAAAAAGAEVLIVVNDRIGGLKEYVGESPIPVATVHRDAGKVSIAMAGTRRAQADRDPVEVQRLCLRPDPRLPGPGSRRAVGVQAEPRRPCQDRRPLLRRQRRPGHPDTATT